MTTCASCLGLLYLSKMNQKKRALLLTEALSTFALCPWATPLDWFDLSPKVHAFKFLCDWALSKRIVRETHKEHILRNTLRGSIGVFSFLYSAVIGLRSVYSDFAQRLKAMANRLPGFFTLHTADLCSPTCKFPFVSPCGQRALTTSVCTHTRCWLV